MFDLDLALRFAAAIGLGLLLGIERERKRDAELFFGGVRTFALIALLGAVGAFMERELNQGWLIIAAFVALSALVIVSYATTAARGELGITTEISAMLAFIVGALCRLAACGGSQRGNGGLPAAPYLQGFPASFSPARRACRYRGDSYVCRDQRHHFAAPAQSEFWTTSTGRHQSL